MEREIRARIGSAGMDGLVPKPDVALALDRPTENEVEHHDGGVDRWVPPRWRSSFDWLDALRLGHLFTGGW
jgi:hypothetical protein